MHPIRTCRAAVVAAAVILWTALPVAAEDAVWNLRTPEWNAVFDEMGDAEEARLRLIGVASKLLAYSGQFYPVAPVGAPLPDDASLAEGHVPVATQWLGMSEAVLAFGLARGWAHMLLEHEPQNFASPLAERAAWERDLRYRPADETEADQWAGRFLADFGYGAEPVMASLCLRADAAASGDPNDYGARAGALADVFEDILGLRPQAICAPASVAAVEEIEPQGSCEERFDACRIAAEDAIYACYEQCLDEKCDLACSSGSSDQCNSCATSCSRRCNSNGIEAYDLCEENFEACVD